MPDSAQPAHSPTYSDGVFINCPFDEAYQPLFDAAIFAVADCGFVPHCSLEDSDGGEPRLHKIIRLLKSCRYSIHDISRTELDKKSGLPRFNMPLELGIDLGLRHSGEDRWADKKCIVLDTEAFRFQQFISDIAGQDPCPHANDPDRIIRTIRDWLRTVSGRTTIPSAAAIIERYALFRKALPVLSDDTPRDKMPFVDYATFAGVWLVKNPFKSKDP
ncbi:MAG: hypothetical protein M0D55_08350 [Elusimicrobiota bacterium]|nr:MAG: hypothetical protein M0D55_08350 [Elusimicrobiota bacterium]